MLHIGLVIGHPRRSETGDQIRRTAARTTLPEAGIEALSHRAHAVARLGLDRLAVGQALVDTLAQGVTDIVSASVVAQADQLEIAGADGRLVTGCTLQHLQVAEAVAPEIAVVRVVLVGVATDHQGCEIARRGRARPGGGSSRHRLTR
ncbi:hypothetical protein D3C85_1170260 [compost metagenome]